MVRSVIASVLGFLLLAGCTGGGDDSVVPGAADSTTDPAVTDSTPSATTPPEVRPDVEIAREDLRYLGPLERDPPAPFTVENGTTALVVTAFLNATGPGAYWVQNGPGVGSPNPILGFYSPNKTFPGPGEARITFNFTQGVANGPMTLEGPLGKVLRAPLVGEWEAMIFGMGSNVHVHFAVVARYG